MPRLSGLSNLDPNSETWFVEGEIRHCVVMVRRSGGIGVADQPSFHVFCHHSTGRSDAHLFVFITRGEYGQILSGGGD